MDVYEAFLEVKYHIAGREGLIEKRHTHNDIEIIQCLSGSGHALVNNKIYPLKANTVYFIQASLPHFIRPDVPEVYMRNKIVISYDFFQKCCQFLNVYDFASSLFGGAPVYWPTSGIPGQLDKLFYGMHDEYKKHSSCSGAFLTVHMLHIFEQAYYGLDSNVNLISIEGTAGKILEYINGHENISLFSIDDMCENLHINKYYACHRFKETSGMTIMNYVAHRKISHAKIMLADSALSIAEISDSLEYADPSSFARAFRRIEGCTPRHYRNKRY